MKLFFFSLCFSSIFFLHQIVALLMSVWVWVFGQNPVYALLNQEETKLFLLFVISKHLFFSLTQTLIVFHFNNMICFIIFFFKTIFFSFVENPAIQAVKQAVRQEIARFK